MSNTFKVSTGIAAFMSFKFHYHTSTAEIFNGSRDFDEKSIESRIEGRWDYRNGFERPGSIYTNNLKSDTEFKILACWKQNVAAPGKINWINLPFRQRIEVADNIFDLWFQDLGVITPSSAFGIISNIMVTVRVALGDRHLNLAALSDLDGLEAPIIRYPIPYR